MNDKYLSIEAVGKTFDTRRGGFVALAGIDLAVAKGEFVSLIGHSGCGKSTLLNLVAGLTRATEGAILGVPPGGQFHDWMIRMIRVGPTDQAVRAEAVREIISYLGRLIDERMDDGGAGDREFAHPVRASLSR